jgi:hypothetical protein
MPSPVKRYIGSTAYNTGLEGRSCSSWTNSSSSISSENGGTSLQPCGCYQYYIDRKCTCNQYSQCPSNCTCNEVCDCNLDRYCRCNNDNERKCSVKENPKINSSYTWTDIIISGRYDVIVKKVHIDELRNALLLESQRRSYAYSESITDSATPSCPSNVSVYYKNIVRTPSTIISNLNQTPIALYDTVFATTWSNITNFITLFRNNSNSCVINVADMSSVNTVIDSNLRSIVALQTFIQAISSLRDIIDEMSKSCVCNSKVVSSSCVAYYYCSSNYLGHSNYDYKYTRLYCETNSICPCNSKTVDLPCPSNCTCNKVCSYHCYGYAVPCSCFNYCNRCNCDGNS